MFCSNFYVCVCVCVCVCAHARACAFNLLKTNGIPSLLLGCPCDQFSRQSREWCLQSTGAITHHWLPQWANHHAGNNNDRGTVHLPLGKYISFTDRMHLTNNHCKLIKRIGQHAEIDVQKLCSKASKNNQPDYTEKHNQNTGMNRHNQIYLGHVASMPMEKKNLSKNLFERKRERREEKTKTKTHPRKASIEANSKYMGLANTKYKPVCCFCASQLNPPHGCHCSYTPAPDSRWAGTLTKSV